MTKRKLFALIAIALIALAVDQVSKILVVRSLQSPGASTPVLGDLVTFVLTYNRAGVFGLNIAHGLTYFVFPILGIVLVVLFARSAPHLGFTASFGLILGGAFGNLIDRVFRPQGVVDFISIRLAPLGITWPVVNPWFIFNVADLCLVVGIILVLAFEIFAHSRARPESESLAAAPPDPKPDAAEPVQQSKQ